MLRVVFMLRYLVRAQLCIPFVCSFCDVANAAAAWNTTKAPRVFCFTDDVAVSEGKKKCRERAHQACGRQRQLKEKAYHQQKKTVLFWRSSEAVLHLAFERLPAVSA